MLHVSFTNRVKLVTQKLKTTFNLGQREYLHCNLNDLGIDGGQSLASKEVHYEVNYKSFLQDV